MTLSSPSFTVIGDLCSNNGLTFQNNTVETGIEDVVGYLWDIDGTASTETNPTFTFATSGSKSVGLQAYIPGCTTSIDYQVLSVATGPSVSFDFSNNCSVGSTVEFTSSVTGDGIDSYLWDFGDGSGSSMLENPTYSYGSAGTYTVSLTVSNDDGCSATISQDIEVTDDARVEIVLSAATENIETTFLANDLIVEDPAVSWSWTFAALGSSTDQNPSFTFPVAGDYSIDLEVTTSQGCTYNLMETLTVMEAACPTSSFEVPGSVCLEETIVFTNNSVNSVNYSWDFCVGDLGETPTAENILTDASLGLASQLAVVEDGGNFYGFSVDRGTGKLFRWDYGTSLDEASPTLVDMGVIDASISETYSIDIVEEGGTGMHL